MLNQKQEAQSFITDIGLSFSDLQGWNLKRHLTSKHEGCCANLPWNATKKKGVKFGK
jgi:hypothetical protein